MKALLISCALLLPLNAIAADTVPFTPGKWKFDTTVSTPLMQQPMKHTQTDCVVDQELSVQKFIQQSGNSCQINHLRATGSELKFALTCLVQGSTMTGTGRLFALNDKMNGTMDVQMMMQGMPMQIRTSWVGKRIGDCQ